MFFLGSLVSRQLGEVFLPMARKTYIPDDPSTLFDFKLGDVHRLRDPAGRAGDAVASESPEAQR